MKLSLSSQVRRVGQRSFLVSLTLLASVVILLMAIGIGSVSIRPQDILRILAFKLFGRPLDETVPANLVGIMWSVRLPRVLLAFLVGAALSASGVVMQSVLKNPLASSFTLGVSSGSSLGAAFVLLFGLSGGSRSSLSFPLAGFIFGVGTVFLVLAISRRVDKRMENTTIILIGLVISQFFGGILTLLMSLARETMERLVLWQMGSFSGLGWSAVAIVALALVLGSVVLMRYHRELDVMTFGEAQALTLGINLPFVKPFVLVITALLTGASISLTGVIGFVDLIAPHLTRRIFGSSHRVVLPMSMLLGGSLMVLADLLARTLLSPRELPVGAITAIIGAPFFAYVYFKRRKGGAV